MSLNRLITNLAKIQNLNETSNATLTSGNVPTQIFESLVPGYSPIHRFILVTFGVDITIFITFFATVWAFGKLGNYVYKLGYGLIAENYMSSVCIENHDDIYQHLLKWLAEQPNLKTSRYLMAETTYKSAWEVDDEELDDRSSETSNEDVELEVLNFSKQEAKVPPRYIPAYGVHHFWHKSTHFYLHRSYQSVLESSSSTKFADKEDITLSCFGRTPQPIKNLLQDAKDFYLFDNNAKTVIRRPAPKDNRRWGSRNYWTQVAHRPCRPMATVVLDPKRKAEVLADINEYLHPSTPRWYANRGIPYRRGYLFYGPCGTGKTSLSFALAGVFGLDIYVISLLEPTLTEEDLGQLFNALPRRCVVLLEDIDTAGLSRSEKSEEVDAATPRSSVVGSPDSEQWKMVDLVKSLKKANDATEEEKKKGISLSGLLNAIDGVASHEGRVLVMTTNKPEKLDEALIRPGRVDLQVAFGNATQPQIQELFERMYISDAPRSRLRTTVSKGHNEQAAQSFIHKSPASPSKSSNSISSISTAAKTTVKAAYGLPERTLKDCARDFAEKIPDGVFSPAEVQGFLLKRKKNPQRACMEVERWVEGMMDLKKSRGKVLDVQ